MKMSDSFDGKSMQVLHAGLSKANVASAPESCLPRAKLIAMACFLRNLQYKSRDWMQISYQYLARRSDQCGRIRNF